MDEDLDILFKYKNFVDHKKAWGKMKGFIKVLSANTTPFL